MVGHRRPQPLFNKRPFSTATGAVSLASEYLVSVAEGYERILALYDVFQRKYKNGAGRGCGNQVCNGIMKILRSFDCRSKYFDKALHQSALEAHSNAPKPKYKQDLCLEIFTVAFFYISSDLGFL